MRDGVVSVVGGRIASVGKKQVGARPRDLGNVAILPGLINAHTHLEFSSLERPLGVPGMRFADWIGAVVDQRRGLLAELAADLAVRRTAAVQRGLRESADFGVAAMGEIATPDWPETAYSSAATDLHTTLFLELLGLGCERVEPLTALARDYLRRRTNGNQLVAGLSPHAPYTVHPNLLSVACQASRASGAPLAMHLAESPEEIELLWSHSGPLVELLESLGAWHPGVLPRGLTPRYYLEALAQAQRALIIHGNYLTRDEMGFLAERRKTMSVVVCPRTHAFFRHSQNPLPALLAAGVRVAVGTDSRASNPDLNLWAELRHLAQTQPTIAPEEILAMGTLRGAEALGIDDQFGSLQQGKSAALAVVPLPESDGDPHQLLLAAGAEATTFVG